MREILFRGKCVDNNEWVEGSFCRDALEQTRGDFLDGFIRRFETDTRKMAMYEVDRETVGQYTGLKDKDGKRIFEGDIINCYTMTGLSDFREKAVNWNGMFCGWYAGEIHNLCYGLGDIYEIVGNIHDNPELLEAGDTDV